MHYDNTVSVSIFLAGIQLIERPKFLAWFLSSKFVIKLLFKCTFLLILTNFAEPSKLLVSPANNLETPEDVTSRKTRK